MSANEVFRDSSLRAYGDPASPHELRWRRIGLVLLWPVLVGHDARPHGYLAVDTSVFVANVADANTGAPVVDAQVAIPELSRTARTNWIGEAQIPAVPRGQYRVQVRRLGYAAADLVIRFSQDTVGYVFMLTPVPLSLDTVTTSAKARIPLKLQDFEWRRRMGIGRFLTDSILLAERTKPIARIMETHLPGLNSVGFDRTVTRFDCGRVDVYVDGVAYGPTRPLGRGRGAGDETDLRSLWGENVAGVEYYSAAGAPVQYRKTGASRCGLVLIWLRP